MKFKIGQVVAVKSGHRLYHYVSGMVKDRGDWWYFLDGETAIREVDPVTLERIGPFRNIMWLESMLRPLTAREAGR
jgi:hypothetical protein